jgi:hypothetical protein
MRRAPLIYSGIVMRSEILNGLPENVIGDVWTDASSRGFKQDIENLDSNEAMPALKSLQPHDREVRLRRGGKRRHFRAERNQRARDRRSGPPNVADASGW